MNDKLETAIGLTGHSPVPFGFAERAEALFRAGGPVVAILIAMSVGALAIVFVKLWQFRTARLGDRKVAHEALRLYRAGRPGEALVLAGHSCNPAAQALAHAIRGQRRGICDAKVREEVTRYGADVLESLRAWFRPLELIASLAPLLGLFGTVLGMIEAFRQLEQAGNRVNPAILSGGIWEALLTTAVGLAVAIPATVVLNWLDRKVDRLAHEMDNVVTQVFTEDLSGKTDEEESHEPTRLRPAAAAAGR
ncbi:MAG: MotA/TolQ/ExbB proton channel family protein [Alphaproteobacteria bacterium]|nr:MAG: MotA/TolQ/ExbB proton channel family protein [Alphaproteobacteria bacterium]